MFPRNCFGLVVQGSPTSWWGALGLALGFIPGACACRWALGFAGPAHHLFAVLVRISCRDPSDMLSEKLQHDLVQLLLRS